MAKTTYEKYLDYAEKLDRITIRVHKDNRDGFTKESLQQAATASGVSINQLIIDAINEKLNKN